MSKNFYKTLKSPKLLFEPQTTNGKIITDNSHYLPPINSVRPGTVSNRKNDN